MTEQEWLTSNDPQAMLSWAQGEDLHGQRLYPLSDRKLRLYVEACRQIAWPRAAGWANKLDTPSEVMRAASDWCCPEVVARRPTQAERAALLRCIFGNQHKPARLGRPCPDCHGKGKVKQQVDTQAIEMYCKRCLGEGVIGKRDWLTNDVKAQAQAAYEERPGRKCDRCAKAEVGFTLSGGVPGCPHCRGTGRVEDDTMDPVTLSVLADALEDAGCGDAKCEVCEVDRPTGAGTTRLRVSDLHVKTGRSTRRIYLPECIHCHGTGRVQHPLIAHLRSPGPHVRGCHVVDLILGKE